MSLRSWRRPPGAAFTVIVSSLLSACGIATPPARPAADDPAPNRAAEAMSPRALRISPLTRLEPADRSVPAQALMLYFSLVDEHDGPRKALGLLRVELRPTTGAADPRRPVALWEVDLRDPGANARAFDALITNTYTITLRDLPAWVRDPDSPDQTLLLNVRFSAVDAGWGGPRVLQAEQRLGK